MTGPPHCRHRRPRPLLQVLFVLAVAIIALGYGLLAGVAHGFADAIDRATAVPAACTEPLSGSESP